MVPSGREGKEIDGFVVVLVVVECVIRVGVVIVRKRTESGVVSEEERDEIEDRDEESEVTEISETEGETHQWVFSSHGK